MLLVKITSKGTSLSKKRRSRIGLAKLLKFNQLRFHLNIHFLVGRRVFLTTSSCLRSLVSKASGGSLLFRPLFLQRSQPLYHGTTAEEAVEIPSREVRAAKIVPGDSVKLLSLFDSSNLHCFSDYQFPGMLFNLHHTYFIILHFQSGVLHCLTCDVIYRNPC